MRQLIPASPTGDLRMLAVGAGAWLGTVIALLWPAAAPVLLSVAGLLAALGAGLIVRRRHTESREARPAGEQGPQGWSAASWGWLLVTCAVVGCCCGGLAAARQAAVERSPAATLGAAGAVGEAELVLTSDPRLVQGSFGPFVVVRARTARVAGRGTAYDVRSPVVVMAEPDWSALRLGTRVRTDVRWDAPDDIGVSALVVPRGDPEVISEPERCSTAPRRCAHPCGIRSPASRRTGPPWCRRWSSATTPRSPTSWPRTSAPRDSPTCSR